ncbi:uncharacterized protein LOC130890867 isoform X2 [Diorhabda carinulata]|uniref:uncharacterized protein LOC130890867 isoform X2 n=1 Tax=Diorhabda carinulata TaxID=1163345 RepID=UPI0025A2E921|nr:uncharacterized protein LOC130890867 isoform X2 [Diorhabda carinulata]
MFFKVLICLAISTNIKSSSATFDFLFDDCFPANEDARIAYTGTNILQVLNSQAGSELFLPTQNGLKLNVDSFAKVLGNCIKNKFDNKHLGDLLHRRERDLTALLNFALADREISFEEIDNLIDSKAIGLRSRRDLVFPFNLFQSVIADLIIKPLQTGFNNAITNFNESLFLYYVDPSNVTDAVSLLVVNSINGGIQMSIDFLTVFKSEVNDILDYITGNSNGTTDNTTRSTGIQSRDSISSIISTIVDSVITPLNQTVNSVIESSKTALTALLKETTNNPIDNIVNSIYNSAISTIIEGITEIQSQIIIFFNAFISETESD